MTMTQNQSQPSSAHRAPSTSGTLGNEQPSASQTGDQASWVDPVCGMNVKRLSAFFTAEHDGSTYRFCSEACRADFEKEPQRFTNAARPEIAG